MHNCSLCVQQLWVEEIGGGRMSDVFVWKMIDRVGTIVVEVGLDGGLWPYRLSQM